MDDSTVINLEMQLHNEYNRPERSLIYLCRLFDNLERNSDIAGKDSIITEKASGIARLEAQIIKL